MTRKAKQKATRKKTAAAKPRKARKKTTKKTTRRPAKKAAPKSLFDELSDVGRGVWERIAKKFPDGKIPVELEDVAHVYAAAMADFIAARRRHTGKPLLASERAEMIREQTRAARIARQYATLLGLTAESPARERYKQPEKLTDADRREQALGALGELRADLASLQ